MKRALFTIIFAGLVFVLGAGQARAAGAKDATSGERMMNEADELFVAADREHVRGNSDVAGRLYARAQRLYMSLAEDFPEKDKDTVEKRILHCDDRIGEILEALLSGPPVSAAMSPPKQLVRRRPDESPPTPTAATTADTVPAAETPQERAKTTPPSPDSPILDSAGGSTQAPVPQKTRTRLVSPQAPSRPAQTVAPKTPQKIARRRPSPTNALPVPASKPTPRTVRRQPDADAAPKTVQAAPAKPAAQPAPPLPTAPPPGYADASASMNREIALLIDDMHALDSAEQELRSEAAEQAKSTRPRRPRKGIFASLRDLVPRRATATRDTPTADTGTATDGEPQPEEAPLQAPVRIASLVPENPPGAHTSPPASRESRSEAAHELPSDIDEVAYIYLRGGAPERAEKLLSDGLTQAPHRHDLRLLLAMARCQTHDYEDAAELAKHVLRNDAGNAKAHVVLGTAYLGMGDIDLAKDQMNFAIEMNPDQGAAHYNLAHLWTAIDPPDLAAARRHYTRSIELGAAQDPELERLLR